MRIILHIGQQKTGSTSLQRFLKKNRRLLKENGILYPKSLGKNKQKVLVDIINTNSSERIKYIDQLQSEIKSSQADTLILSEENLYNIDKDKMKILHKILSEITNNITVVVYLRRQDCHMVSMYQQYIRGKGIMTLEDYIEAKLDSEYYMYSRIIKKWESIFSEIICRPYKLQGIDSRKDFINIIGISNNKLDYTEDEIDKNRSIDIEAIETIRLINKLEDRGNLNIPHDIKRRLRIYYKNNIGRKTLQLNQIQKKQISSKFMDDNLSIDKLCMNNCGSLLFRPETSKGTTTQVALEDIILKIVSAMN